MEQIAITLPADWIHLDVSDKGRRTAREKVERLAEAIDADQAALQRIKQMFQGAVYRARKQNAVLAAVWAAPLDDDSLLSASLTVTFTPVTPRVGLTEDGSIDLADVADEMTASLGPRDEVTALERVTLPVSDAMRLVRRDRTGPAGAQTTTLTVQHFVPVPGQPAMAVVTFSTSASDPATELNDRFVALFDQLTATLRFDGTPTHSEATPPRAS